MKNITISLPDDLAHRAKIFAAEQNTSVSRYVGALLSEKLESEAGYRAALRRWAAVPPARLTKGGGPYPGRDSLYDR